MTITALHELGRTPLRRISPVLLRNTDELLERHGQTSSQGRCLVPGARETWELIASASDMSISEVRISVFDDGGNMEIVGPGLCFSDPTGHLHPAGFKSDVFESIPHMPLGDSTLFTIITTLRTVHRRLSLDSTNAPALLDRVSTVTSPPGLDSNPFTVIPR